MTRAAFRALPIALMCAIACIALTTTHQATAQKVDTTPSRQTLDEAAQDNCEGISPVVQRCGPKPGVAPPKASTDSLTQSREKTKAGFDRVDQRSRDEALKGQPPAANTPTGDEAQRLGGVTVTGKAGDNAPQPEEVIQRALAQPERSGTGTTITNAPNGTRYECIEKCVGPACCKELRVLPNPARDVNSLNGH